MAVEHFNKRIICLSNFLRRNSDFTLLNVNSFWFSFLCDSELNVLGSAQGNSKPKAALRGHKNYIKRNLKRHSTTKQNIETS